MLKTTSPIGSSTILQLLINAANRDEIGRDEGVGNETNLSNLFTSKRSIKAGYLTPRSAKKGGNNSEKSVKAAKDSNYLTRNAKKPFNHLRHVFTQALIFQHFDPEQHI